MLTSANRLQFRWLQDAPGPVGINSAALLAPSLVKPARLPREPCELVGDNSIWGMDAPSIACSSAYLFAQKNS